MAKNIKDLSKSLRDNLDLTAYSQVGHTHQYAGSSTVGGSATSAVKLATARAINGTNFDGTAAITTAKWGTVRTLTIGNSGKSVDGSDNVSWTLTEIGAAASGHTHNYAGSSSAGGAANSVANNLTIKLNSGTTEGTNLFTFNGSAAKSINITPSAIGAAGTSHGTHVSYSTTTPKVAGTGAVGSESSVARGDHVHPAQTSVTGNAGTATKLATARNITIGNKTNSFDGSANISYTLSDIGAAASSHTHTIANITDLRVKNGSSGVTVADPYQSWAHSDVINNDILFGGSYSHTSANANIVYCSASGKLNMVIDGEYYAAEGKQRVYHTGYKPTYSDVGAAAASHGTHVTYSTTTPKVAGTAAAGSESAVARGDHVHAAQTSVSGNAGTATKLQTARTITLSGAVTGSTSFDGSGNVTISTSVNHTHNYAGSSSAGGAATSANKVNSSLKVQLNNGTTEGTNQFTFDGSAAKTINITPNNIGAAASSHGTHVTYSTTTPKVAGTAAVGSESGVSRGDHVHPAQTSVTGNAGTATKLATARTITIGSTGKTFDGSANVSWTAAEMGVLPMTGNTGAYSMTGNVEFASPANGTFRGVVGKCGVNDYWRVVGNASADNAGYMEIATADDGTEPIYVRQYTGAYATVTRTLTLLDGSGNTSMPGNLSVTKGVSAQDITASGNVTVTGTVKVGSVTMKYNDTSESLDFIFA